MGIRKKEQMIRLTIGCCRWAFPRAWKNKTSSHIYNIYVRSLMCISVCEEGNKQKATDFNWRSDIQRCIQRCIQRLWGETESFSSITSQLCNYMHMHEYNVKEEKSSAAFSAATHLYQNTSSDKNWLHNSCIHIPLWLYSWWLIPV